MAYYDDVNTEYCPNCNEKIAGIDALGSITDDSKCSCCGIPLLRVRIDVGSFNEAPYTVYAIETDLSRVRNRE